MKVFKFHPLAINPIHRDLIIVLIAGILVSVALITLGFTVMVQIKNSV